MSYILELSFSLSKSRNITSLINNIETIAFDHMCDKFNINYEFMGKNRTIYKNNCVLSIDFNENSEKYLTKFIKKIKELKYIKLEILYYDNINIDILYASKKYLQTMTKENMQKYKDNKQYIFEKYKNILNKIK